jgi:hypothetical protein
MEESYISQNFGKYDIEAPIKFDVQITQDYQYGLHGFTVFVWVYCEYFEGQCG